MKKPVLHLICNAHLDPVWQWRWEEGAAVAVSTFAVAARLLREFPEFVFNHNEAILYRWVQEHDPGLFEEIRRLVREGRWCISGGWDLQPDVNMPGTEALIRHIVEGRRYFQEYFDARPRVAYNFDSFGHTGGLPQLLARSGYAMYIHMRPEQKDLPIPSDLYCWEGLDGTRIGAYRIPFSAYNTFPGAAAERIHAATELALRLNRDTPVFWGLGDHGGGASREELLAIRELMAQDGPVEIIHSSTERFYDAVKHHFPSAPVVRGDLQRVFTGCYTSMARVKRRMQRNLGELLQTESICAAAWWERGEEYPAAQLRDAWRDHLFNDFHDILPGSSIEEGELDALDLYGRSSETHRRLRLGAVAGFAKGPVQPFQIPLTVLNTNPAGAGLPVEVEYMIDPLPRLTGAWHARLFMPDGKEIPAQEESAEMLLLVDQWRRKLCFTAPLPQVGAAHFRIEMFEGRRMQDPAPAVCVFRINPATELVAGLEAGGVQLLSGDLLRPLVVDDDADSWGMERWKYRDVVGEFALVPGSASMVESGPVRTIREAAYVWGKSRIVVRMLSYASFPFLEYRLRILWNEERKRLKLAFPTLLRREEILCEVPGGTIGRPADGEEHTHGRWMIMEGDVAGVRRAFAIVNSGQHGFDALEGEVRLSVLRSAPYCYDRAFALRDRSYPRVMDLGVHEVRLIVAPGERRGLLQHVTGWADWLVAPPYALAHYSIGPAPPEELLRIRPESVRLLACKQSWDGQALIVRLQELQGIKTRGELEIQKGSIRVPLAFEPFEIKTVRCGRDGSSEEVEMIDETAEGLSRAG